MLNPIRGGRVDLPCMTVVDAVDGPYSHQYNTWMGNVEFSTTRQKTLVLLGATRLPVFSELREG